MMNELIRYCGKYGNIIAYAPPLDGMPLIVTHNEHEYLFVVSFGSDVSIMTTSLTDDIDKGLYK